MNDALIVLIYLTPAILLDIRSRKGKLRPAIRFGASLEERERERELSRSLCSGITWTESRVAVSVPRVRVANLTATANRYCKKDRS